MSELEEDVMKLHNYNINITENMRNTTLVKMKKSKKIKNKLTHRRNTDNTRMIPCASMTRVI